MKRSLKHALPLILPLAVRWARRQGQTHPQPRPTDGGTRVGRKREFLLSNSYQLSRHPMILLACMLTAVLFAERGWAIVEPDNMGRWTKPTKRGPDKEVPGFLVNLGPTGARAVLKERSFVVKHVFAESPADKQAQDRRRDHRRQRQGVHDKHIFGKCYGMGYDVGYEGPIMDFGNAIEDSEGRDGILKLDVHPRRQGDDRQRAPARHRPVQQHLPAQLPEVRRSCSPMPWSTSLKHTRGLRRTMSHEGHGRPGPAGRGKMKEAEAGRGLERTCPARSVDVVSVAYQCIFLCEYYLKTGDKRVLKTIEELGERLYLAQVHRSRLYKDRMHGGKPQAKNFLKGGLGHGHASPATAP